MRDIWKAFAVSVFVICTQACGQGAPDAASAPSLILAFDGAQATNDDELSRHGERLTKVLGCTGCHRADFSGGPFNEGWIAPNLSLMTAEYDNASLERAIRQGVALDGRKLRMMPSEMYRSLSDTDMFALGAFILGLEPTGVAQAPFEPFAADLAAWEATGYTNANALGREWSASAGPLEGGPEHARGRYLAMNLCTECHNNQLQGYPGFTPDLAIIAGYSDDEFKRLLHEGKGKARERLGLMSLVSPARFPYLTDDEHADLTGYLRARAKRMLEDQ